MPVFGLNLGRVPSGGMPTADWLNRLAAEVERLGRISATSPLVASSGPAGVMLATDVYALQNVVSSTFTGGTVTGATTFQNTATFQGNVIQGWTFVSWTGAQNNYALPTGTRYLGVTLTGNATLTGIAGGVEGRALTIVLIDNGGFTLTLSDSSASSSAANRIQLQNLASYVLSEQVQGIELVYASDGATIDNWLMADDRLIVDEDDASPIVSNVRKLRFEADHFTVTEPSTGTAKVDLKAAQGASVYHSSVQSVSSSGSTLLVWNSENFDTASYHSTVSNTSRLTAPTAGKYIVGFNIAFSWSGTTPTADDRFTGRVLLNGSGLGSRAIQQTNPLGSTISSAGGGCVSASGYLNLSANDYVEVDCNADGNSGIGVDENYANFWIARIGD